MNHRPPSVPLPQGESEPADGTIRLATPADIPAIHRLVEGAYRGDSARRGWTHEADLLDGQRTDLTALAAILSDPAQRVMVADAGTLVGCVQVTRVDTGLGYLGMLSVDPTMQGGGWGRRLMTAAETLARDQFGASRMEMTVIRQRGELIAWYERCGYRRTGEARPFPLDDPRFGMPRTRDLEFVVLARSLGTKE